MCTVLEIIFVGCANEPYIDTITTLGQLKETPLCIAKGRTSDKHSVAANPVSLKGSL